VSPTTLGIFPWCQPFAEPSLGIKVSGCQASLRCPAQVLEQIPHNAFSLETLGGANERPPPKQAIVPVCQSETEVQGHSDSRPHLPKRGLEREGPRTKRSLLGAPLLRGSSWLGRTDNRRTSYL
jgi:hypothetical protein